MVCQDIKYQNCGSCTFMLDESNTMKMMPAKAVVELVHRILSDYSFNEKIIEITKVSCTGIGTMNKYTLEQEAPISNLNLGVCIAMLQNWVEVNNNGENDRYLNIIQKHLEYLLMSDNVVFFRHVVGNVMSQILSIERSI